MINDCYYFYLMYNFERINIKIYNLLSTNYLVSKYVVNISKYFSLKVYKLYKL